VTTPSRVGIHIHIYYYLLRTSATTVNASVHFSATAVFVAGQQRMAYHVISLFGANIQSNFHIRQSQHRLVRPWHMTTPVPALYFFWGPCLLELLDPIHKVFATASEGIRFVLVSLLLSSSPCLCFFSTRSTDPLFPTACLTAGLDRHPRSPYPHTNQIWLTPTHSSPLSHFWGFCVQPFLSRGIYRLGTRVHACT
jgi:hypothetical protein